MSRDREQHRAAQREYMKRMREAGYARMWLWVPQDDQELKERIRAYAAKEEQRRARKREKTVDD